MQTEDRPPLLLQLLDAFVRKSDGPASARGKLAIGVGPDPTPSERAAWWCVELAGRATTEFSTRCPPDVSAALYLTEPQAARVLAGEALVGARAFGDAALLTTVVDRYLQSRSALALRASDKVTRR